MKKQTITVIPGDGIGSEIMLSTLRVLDKLDCNLDYDTQLAGLAAIEEGKELIPEETLNSIRRNSIALKGPLTTPIGRGFSSLNVTLRKEFDLYANVRPAITYEGIQSRYQDIDLITIRENTEGMYSQEKQILSADGERAESTSVITKESSTRILRFAFEMAKRGGRKNVAVVHKANILKTTSGLFLNVSRELRKQYPEINVSEYIVDNMCMQLVIRPEKFDVIVTTNLFGDIISDLCAGLVGGLGMAPGANIGDTVAIFEGVHGSAPDIAGKGIANPFALILASAMMLERLNMHDKAEKIRKGIREVILLDDNLTSDLGGSATTDEITSALVKRL